MGNPHSTGDVGNLTIEQYNWLVDQLDSYISSIFLAHVEDFWSSIFTHFFDMWPERDVLWPTMSANRILSRMQMRSVVAAEEQHKQVRGIVIPFNSALFINYVFI
jgi:hypothetical protein